MNKVTYRGASLYVLFALPLLAALAVGFVTLALSLRTFLSDVLYESLDGILSERIENLRTALDGFEETVSRSERTPARFVKFLSDLVADQAKDAELAGTIVLIQNLAGDTLAASRHVHVDGLDSAKTRSARTLLVTFSNGSSISMRVRSDVIVIGSTFSVQVSVARNVDLIWAVEERVTSLLVLAFVAAFVLLSVLLLMIARTLTMPLRRLLDSMRDVNVNNLHEPLTLDSRIREIAQLREQFNLMLDRLDNSFRLQSRFVADVAHQLRTPLAVMGGEIEVALRGSGGSKVFEKVLLSNAEEVRHLKHLLDLLLNLGRLESEQGALDRKLVDLGSIVVETVSDFELVASNRGVTVEVRGPTGILVSLEPALVRQAIINLFDNATKYGKRQGKSEEGKVIFEFGRGAPFINANGHSGSEKQVWIRSTNWGPLIPVEEIPKLGERFFRGSAHVKEGFGLGLSLVRLVAELHGGYLHIESSETSGTAFTLVLNVDGVASTRPSRLPQL